MKACCYRTSRIGRIIKIYIACSSAGLFANKS